MVRARDKAPDKELSGPKASSSESNNSARNEHPSIDRSRYGGNRKRQVRIREATSVPLVSTRNIADEQSSFHSTTFSFNGNNGKETEEWRNVPNRYDRARNTRENFFAS